MVTEIHLNVAKSPPKKSFANNHNVELPTNQPCQHPHKHRDKKEDEEEKSDLLGG